MTTQSRIKFNPITKEIEVEGSETFVKTYFEKLQSLLDDAESGIVKLPKKLKSSNIADGKPLGKQSDKMNRPSKDVHSYNKKEGLLAKGKRGDMSKAILALIQDSSEGITTSDMKAKTGLKENQIWPIVNRAKKKGKITNAKRGVYLWV